MSSSIEQFVETVKKIDDLNFIDNKTFKSLLKLVNGYGTNEILQYEKDEMKKRGLLDNNYNVFPIVKQVIKFYY